MNNTLLLTLVSILMPVMLVGCIFTSDEDNNQAHDSNLLSVDNNVKSIVGSKAGKESGYFQNSNDVVWAVNVGGKQYVGVDGITYQADSSSIIGDVGKIEDIKGSQDSFIYQSYKTGDLAINKAIENGRYDIIFKFAEPENIASGARVFDIFAEQQLIIDDLDVKLARDGKHKSALVRAVYNVEVTDGQLDISFQAIKGQPILNALIVRKKTMNTHQWKLVWNDEFDYQGKPDPSKWSYDIWPARKVNSEDQTYTDSLKNVYVKDGNLVITADKETYGNAEYTSGRIHSQGKGDFLYGRVDVRAKLPAGQGTWSAIWMLPSNPYKYATTCQVNENWQGSSTCDAWPNSGEIDIMEHVGYDMQTIHGTAHNKAYYWANWEQRKGSIEGKNVEQAFHLYSVEWTPENITVFFDNTPYFFYTNESSGWRGWPYDHPYHIILNLAIGGMWGKAGGPIDDSIFPVSMEVDYVRIFKPLAK
ncbi:malectin domain-containing carbohydrate-binding protein [Candidatus Colwellia aromaticivorans]|uniref:malectin domain-containing carbohydrate-binding protein n=1 Tax=Candidatus Colwellia aromaticivorans TaxID=2267621 RepID=UPI001FEAF186|nr:family 16 glycosylhydrolase [Candidatus Colwellia aromaticivorans]